MFREILSATCLAAPLALIAGAGGAMAAGLSAPHYLDDIVLPSGLSLQGVTLGGLSDLAYDPASGRFLAISDDRIEHGPARFYELGLTIEGGAITGLDIAAMHALSAPGGTAFALKGADPEGIALAPSGDRIYWSSERDTQNRPAIYSAARDGSDARALTVPPAYLPGAEAGVRVNMAFEGLDLSADGKTLYAATENALAQDGPQAGLAAGSPARILTIDTATGMPGAEYVYMTEPVPRPAASKDGWIDNGLSALALLPDGRMITVERSFAAGVGFTIQLFLVDLAGADDVAGQQRIDMGAIRTVAKTPWFTLQDGDFPFAVDNVEGIAFGPMIEGRQSMLLVSDDNFNPAEQATHLTLFTVDLPK